MDFDDEHDMSVSGMALANQRDDDEEDEEDSTERHGPKARKAATTQVPELDEKAKADVEWLERLYKLPDKRRGKKRRNENDIRN
jgi:hypothetical protein